MNQLIELKSTRAFEARLSQKINERLYILLISIGTLLALTAITIGLMKGARYGFFIASPASLFLVPALWWKRNLSILPVTDKDITGRLSVDVLGLLKPGETQSSKNLWSS